ncbi:hypothetical protein EMIHUDRAFT_461267 [Emiliania huxleyi CCMP1516]|uniref:ZZ-type domain-containing protein n=2 Tax=Emiliania huxleyi TaxID=2903 RepID=A0A0D3J347_EMIH1|nr:hypothetical protein EMIHUDRAFT_461267 [Emiliania huxleyi CCMP1516]EOD17932.1 hypothetical protein EMIHUDRAFT_461267 [Emiliania huxleyi CCMP1516]|eukprot:XP_005770361.1 hypothetical protein EMIHUDRAFT_461267 [Emiliania huxleyi CCMP1516]
MDSANERGSQSWVCPEEGHSLTDFVPPRAGYKCDLCGETFGADVILFSCRICLWDACRVCAASGRLTLPGNDARSKRISRVGESLEAQIGWIASAVESKAAADDPAALAGIPAPFERTSCFACVPPEDRAWWRFLVPPEWVPPLLVEVRLPSGLLLLAPPPPGSAGTYLRCSIPKSEASARDLAYCSQCGRTNCQCSVKTQLARDFGQLSRRLSFNRRNAVRRVQLDDPGAWAGVEEAKKAPSFSRRRSGSSSGRRTAAEEPAMAQAPAVPLGRSAGAAEAALRVVAPASPAASFPPLAPVLATRWRRVRAAAHLESMAGARLQVAPLPAGEQGVRFEQGVRPPVVHSISDASPLRGVISPGAIVAFVGESTDCAAMDGDALDAALRAHAESERRTLHWIAAADIPDVLASIAEREASLVTVKVRTSWTPQREVDYPTRLALPSGKRATPQEIEAATAELSLQLANLGRIAPGEA